MLCVDEVQDDDAMLNLQHDIESTHALEHMDQVHKLAFCMAMHPRLGAKSSASLLDPEACSAVLDMCKMQVPRRLRTTHLQDMYSASRR